MLRCGSPASAHSGLSAEPEAWPPPPGPAALFPARVARTAARREAAAAVRRPGRRWGRRGQRLGPRVAKLRGPSGGGAAAAAARSLTTVRRDSAPEVRDRARRSRRARPERVPSELSEPLSSDITIKSSMAADPAQPARGWPETQAAVVAATRFLLPRRQRWRQTWPSPRRPRPSRPSPAPSPAPCPPRAPPTRPRGRRLRTEVQGRGH